MAPPTSSVRRYPLLRFTGNVDWQHMNPALLNRLSSLAAAKHVIITVFSGYRSDQYSAQHGGFAGDPHTHGLAADATVNGKSIGSVFSRKVLGQFGLRSGNQPGFYKGKPDPSHVDLIGFGYDNKGNITGKVGVYTSGGKGAATAPTDNAAVGSTAAAPPDQVIGTVPPPQTTAAPELTTPPMMLPGEVAGNQSPVGGNAFWRRVLDQPGVSPSTQQYAQMFGS